VVSFAVRADLDPEVLRRGLNAALPDGVLALAAHRVSRSFHARNTAESRTYAYLVGAPAPELLRRYAWSLPDARAFPGLAAPRLDPGLLRAALAEAVGTHDFAGLARAGARRPAVKTVLRAEVVSAEWAPLHAVVLEGVGFARAMVRNLVGAAVAIAIGAAAPGAIQDLLATRRRYRGVRAPGWGLTLVSVRYPASAFPPPEHGR
jgi:tRNA pseudouridine38-40 synthase